MITLQSSAETAQIVAANAVMLAQDMVQDVLLQWREYTVLVFPEDTSTDVVRIMGLSGATKN